LEGLITELIASFCIETEPRTKKNSHRISGCGPRCPVCGKYKRQFVRNGSGTTDFAYRAASFLYPKPEVPIDREIRLVYLVYTGTRRVVDDLNLYEALDDILVKAKILKDDNRKIIRSRDGSRVLYDKNRPRAEIYIYTYGEVEDG
jgi:hypothetical protein